MVTPLAHGLPDFPWDRLTAPGNIARSHPDGIIDLSIGTPVDATPEIIQAALAAHSNAPGYPTAAGLPDLREAWAAWAKRTLDSTIGQEHVSPLIGSKELVAWLPISLGLGNGDLVAVPELAYPTYAVGALMAGASFVTYKSAQDIPDNASLIWVNSPSNPTGQVLSVEELRALVARGRELGVPVVSDECYIELGWDCDPVSVLHSSVNDGDLTNILSVHSLSKRSNLAGYRSGAVLGDASLINSLIQLRKHSGMLMPMPVQYATITALGDDSHVTSQKALYRKRRDVLHSALVDAGFTIEHSEAGLYLWATRGTDCMDTVAWLAEKGILVAPGDFYGPAGQQYVRVAMTATDERVAAFTARFK